MLVILQGRLKSTRLPCKGFFTFFGQTIWERMCDIANELDFVEKVVFATGDIPENVIAKSLVESKGVTFFAGSEDNVLERFSDIIRSYKYDYVVRITCDNYLVQPDLIEDLYQLVLAQNADYGFIEPLSHYCGEIIKSDLLLVNQERVTVSEEAKEHVTWDVRKNKNIVKVSLPRDYKGLDHINSVTLDTVEDFLVMKCLEQNRLDLESIRCLDALKSIDTSSCCFTKKQIP